MASIPAKYRIVSLILLALGAGFLAYSGEIVKAYPEAGIAIGIIVFAVREVLKEYGTQTPEPPAEPEEGA